MSQIIEAGVIIANLFAIGRKYVALPELKQIRDELNTAFGTVVEANHLDHVYIDIDKDALNSIVQNEGWCFARANGVFFRSEWSLKECYTQKYVDDLFTWRIPLPLREVFHEVLMRHEAEILSETQEILAERIRQLDRMARRFCQRCGDNHGYRFDENHQVIHQGWYDGSYTWDHPVLCRAQPERQNFRQLTKQMAEIVSKKQSQNR